MGVDMKEFSPMFMVRLYLCPVYIFEIYGGIGQFTRSDKSIAILIIKTENFKPINVVVALSIRPSNLT